MSKAVTRLEGDADLVLQQAVDTLYSRWGQTKLQAEGGTGPFLEGAERARILKVVLRRAVAMYQRGSVARVSRATNTPAGTVVY
jgi:hypothetical protein